MSSSKTTTAIPVRLNTQSRRQCEEVTSRPDHTKQRSHLRSPSPEDPSLVPHRPSLQKGKSAAATGNGFYASALSQSAADGHRCTVVRGNLSRDPDCCLATLCLLVLHLLVSRFGPPCPASILRSVVLVPPPFFS